MGVFRVVNIGLLLLAIIFHVSAYGSHGHYHGNCHEEVYSPVCSSYGRTFPNSCYMYQYNHYGYGQHHGYAHDGPCYDRGHPRYYDQYPDDEYSNSYAESHREYYEDAPRPIVIILSPAASSSVPADVPTPQLAYAGEDGGGVADQYGGEIPAGAEYIYAQVPPGSLPPPPPPKY